MGDLEFFVTEDGEFIVKRDGVTLNSKVLDSKLARRVRECALICVEMNEVLYWLEELIKLQTTHTFDADVRTPDNERYAMTARSLFTSACVTYFKYFTHGHGMSIKLVAKKLYDCDQLQTHEAIEEMRHKLIAHIDNSDYLSINLFALKDPRNPSKTSIVPQIVRTITLLDAKLDSFIELVKLVYKHYANEYNKYCHALMKNELGAGKFIDHQFHSSFSPLS